VFALVCARLPRTCRLGIAKRVRGVHVSMAFQTEDGACPTGITEDDQSSHGNVVRNTFAVLRFLGRAQRPVGVTRLAAEVGIPRTTAHRLLEYMAREGVVIRRDRLWTLASGFRDLDRRDIDLENVVRSRLCAMTQATGATIFVYRRVGTALTAFGRSYGRGLSRLVIPYDQAIAAEHPASATWAALECGLLVAEHGQVNPNCSSIATPFLLPCGDTAVLSIGLPRQRDVEVFKRPLDRLSIQIVADIKRMESSSDPATRSATQQSPKAR
jgi:IclR helix-turn-helix domain